MVVEVSNVISHEMLVGGISGCLCFYGAYCLAQVVWLKDRLDDPRINFKVTLYGIAGIAAIAAAVILLDW